MGKISEFDATSSQKTHKIRITEDFSRIIMNISKGSAKTKLSTEKVTIKIETPSKNIVIANNILVKDIVKVINDMQDLPLIDGDESTYLSLSFFNEGTFRLKAGYAVVLEFSEMVDTTSYKFFITKHILESSQLYVFEEKTILEGERSKSFDIPNTLYIKYTPQRGVNEDVVFKLYYIDENGKEQVIEKHFFALMFEVLESENVESNWVIKAGEEQELFIPVFGFHKITIDDPRKLAQSLLFVSELDTNYFEVVEDSKPNFGQVVSAGSLPDLATIKDRGVVYNPNVKFL